jgi:hypothetical protein
MPDAASERALEELWAPVWASARAALDTEAAAAPAPGEASPPWLWPVAAALGGTAAALMLVVTPFLVVPALPRAWFGSLPWLPTPAARVSRALDALRPGLLSPPPAGGRRVYVDWGAGDGVTVLAAAARGAAARGVELNPSLWLWAPARAARARARGDFAASGGSAAFELGDLFKHSVADADVVMLYGVAPLMPRLAAKLAAEAKPDVVILSHRFPLPAAQWGAFCHGSVENVHVYCRAHNPLR